VRCPAVVGPCGSDRYENRRDAAPKNKMSATISSAGRLLPSRRMERIASLGILLISHGVAPLLQEREHTSFRSSPLYIGCAPHNCDAYVQIAALPKGGDGALQNPLQLTRTCREELPNLLEVGQ
jgi:hypothetical protein